MGPTERSLERCPGLVTIDEVGVRCVRAGSICGCRRAGTLLAVNVLAMADRENLDDKAVVLDDAQGAVVADAVAPLA